MNEVLKNDYRLELAQAITPAGDGFQLYVTPRFTSVYEQGYEQLSSRLVKTLAKSTDVFVDVGAHYGYYSILAGSVNPDAKIIAIEPAPQNFSLLRRNLEHNGLLDEKNLAVNAAVSDAPGKIEFCISEASDNCSIYPHPRSTTIERITVDKIALDDLIPRHERQNVFIKTDTDGHEIEVLAGLADTFSFHQVSILMEINPKMLALAGKTTEAVYQRLVGNGLRVFAIDEEESRLTPLDNPASRAEFDDKYASSYYNVLCLPALEAKSLVFFAHSPELGGAERSLVDLVSGLLRKGAACNVVVPGEGLLAGMLRSIGSGVLIAPPALTARWACASLEPFPEENGLPIGLINEFHELTDSIAALSPDFIFSQTIVSPWGVLCAETLGLPHATSVREYGEKDHGLKFRFGYLDTLSAFYESSDLIFTITEDIRKSLFGADPQQKTTVIYSGIDIPDAEAHGLSISSLFNVEEGPIFCLPAAYHPGKGQEDFVRALLMLLDEGVSVRGLLIGSQKDPEYFSRIESLIQSSGYSDNFRCLGFTRDIYPVIDQSDCVVSCSFSEALGRTLIEAALLEVPIIFPDVGGPSEIFTSDEHGRNYSPGDVKGLARCMRLLVDDYASAEAMAKSAREYCQLKFSTEAYASVVLERLNSGRVVKEPRRLASAFPFEKLMTSSMQIFARRTWQPVCFFGAEMQDFSIDRMLSSSPQAYGKFKISFEFPSGVMNVRLDPVEGAWIRLSNLVCSFSSVDGKLVNPEDLDFSSNASKMDDSLLFLTNDPMLIWRSKLPLSSMTVTGNISAVKNEDLRATVGLYEENLFLTKEVNGRNEVLETELAFCEKAIAAAEEVAKGALASQAAAEEAAKGALASQATAEAAANAALTELEAATNEIAKRDTAIAALRSSLSWRLSAPVRLVGFQGRRARRLAQLFPAAVNKGGGVRPLFNKIWRLYQREGVSGLRRGLAYVRTHGALKPAASSGSFDRNDYAEWIRRFDTLTDNDRQTISDRISAMARLPLISVVMPTYNPPIEFLDAAIWSVRHQLYPAWELCIADDASSDPRVKELLIRHSQEDDRIKVAYRGENGHISKATNSALRLAVGEYIALMDNDDLLTEHALYWVAETILQNSDAGLIYSDEDKISEEGERFGPYFKCEYNAELMMAHNMICHLGVYRRDLIERVEGFRTGFEGAQDYDLALRVIELLKPAQIVHIPRILYHWRAIPGSTASEGSAKSYAAEAARLAVTEHLERLGIPAEVHPSPLAPGMLRVRYKLPDPVPKISIIIPTRDRVDLLSVCITSIRERSTYPSIEIVVVDNGSTEQGTFEYFESVKAEGVKVLRSDEPFNFSRLNNLGVREATGQILCLMNNDIEITVPDWAEEMVSYACRPAIGCVGARLLYPNGGLQHGGVILGVGGVAGHSHKHAHSSDFGYFGRAVLSQSLSAVTGACLMIRRDIYEQVGGLDESFAVAFNDVDFCLRVREAGYRNVWTPFAEMVHHESVSRGFEDNPEKIARFNGEINRMIDRWGEMLSRDPAYSPNLTLEHEDFSLAWPPRVRSLS